MAIDGITTATFDCFGTLIDWEGGLANFLYDFALRHGDDQAPDGNTLRERWEEIQFGVIQGPFKLYEEVLAESLRHWAEERGGEQLRLGGTDPEVGREQRNQRTVVRVVGCRR